MSTTGAVSFRTSVGTNRREGWLTSCEKKMPDRCRTEGQITIHSRSVSTGETRRGGPDPGWLAH